MVALRDVARRAGVSVRTVSNVVNLDVRVGTNDQAGGAKAMADLLDRGVEFDAVNAISDELAIGALGGLTARGVDVPGQVALMGFGDTDCARRCVPRLSTGVADLTFVAQTAMAMLIDRIEGDTAPPHRSTVEHRLIARRSTRGEFDI